MLWLDEIQGGISQSNKDTQEAQRCKYPYVRCLAHVWVEGEDDRCLRSAGQDRWLVGMLGDIM